MNAMTAGETSGAGSSQPTPSPASHIRLRPPPALPLIAVSPGGGGRVERTLTAAQHHACTRPRNHLRPCRRPACSMQRTEPRPRPCCRPCPPRRPRLLPRRLYGQVKGGQGLGGVVLAHGAHTPRCKPLVDASHVEPAEHTTPINMNPTIIKAAHGSWVLHLPACLPGSYPDVCPAPPAPGAACPHTHTSPVMAGQHPELISILVILQTHSTRALGLPWDRHTEGTTSNMSMTGHSQHCTALIHALSTAVAGLKASRSPELCVSTHSFPLLL